MCDNKTWQKNGPPDGLVSFPFSVTAEDKACSLGVADVLYIFFYERLGQGSPRVLAVTCLVLMCQLPTSQ